MKNIFQLYEKDINMMFGNLIMRGTSEAVTQSLLKKRCPENMQQIYKRTPMRSAISIKLHNHTLAWVFSCKFAAYFQDTFSQKHL